VVTGRTTTTLAAIAHRPGSPFSLERVELPALTERQILVRLEAVGICHADVGARSGQLPVTYPVVLGHEGCGVVQQVGSGVTTVEAGQRVVLTFDTCGSCSECRADRPARCSEQYVRDWVGDASTPRGTAAGTQVQLGFFGQSSFAQYAITGPRNTVPVDADVPAHLLAPLGCGVQTGFGAVSNVACPGPGQCVAVFGAGGVGMSAVMALAQAPGVGSIVVDPDPRRRQLALKLGATHVIDPGAADPAEAIRAVFPDGVHAAVECSGRPDAIAAALRSTGQGGILVLVGTPPAGVPAELDVFNVVLGSKRIQGCIEGDDRPQDMIPSSPA
jgi:aryl-alcohol dehydrogenase